MVIASSAATVIFSLYRDSQQNQSGVSPAFTAADIKRVNDTARETDGNDFIALAGARPSYQVDDKGNRLMAASRDVDASYKKQGTYQLRVFCLGEGNLDVEFSVGKATSKKVHPCTADEVSNTVLLVSSDEADNSVVNISPLPQTRSACSRTRSTPYDG